MNREIKFRIYKEKGYYFPEYKTRWFYRWERVSRNIDTQASYSMSGSIMIGISFSNKQTAIDWLEKHRQKIIDSECCGVVYRKVNEKYFITF